MSPIAAAVNTDSSRLIPAASAFAMYSDANALNADASPAAHIPAPAASFHFAALTTFGISRSAAVY